MQAFTLTTHDPRRKLYPCLIARAYLSAGDLVEAERWARRFLEDDPKEPRAYPLLASVLAHAGQLDEARAAAVTAERLHPGYAAHWSGAREYREEGRNDYFIEGLRLAGLDL
jgi:Flp pilus assembly protein TadD